MSRSDEGSDVASRTANRRNCSGLAKLAADEPRIVLRQAVGGKACSIPSRREFSVLHKGRHARQSNAVNQKMEELLR